MARRPPDIGTRPGRNRRVQPTRLVGLAASTLVALSGVAAGCSGPKPSSAPPMSGKIGSAPTSSTVSALESRPLRLPSLTSGQPCPATSGQMLTLANATGPAILVGAVGVMIPQRGNFSAGTVDLAQSDIPGWYGIKTHWLVRPTYRGPLIVRARSLDGSGPISILGDGGAGPLVISSASTSNGVDGWREQPSGSYVKHPGCYGVQFDGTSFSVKLVFKAIIPSAAAGP